LSIYLDHAATSPPTKNVLDYYRDVLSQFAYNPSSMHGAGKKARALIDESLDSIASCFGATPEQVIVTSGGTEAINMALKGYVTPRRFTPHLLISAGEHKAVTAVANLLKADGVKVTIIPLDRHGCPDISKVEQTKGLPPTMISVIGVSNETGAATDIESIVAWRNEHVPHAVIHVDAVQAAGKQAIDFSGSDVDFLSLSAHKWGAPMGLGFLVAKKHTLLTPLISGAGQQGGLRSGSENAPLIAATALALTAAIDSLDKNKETAGRLKETLVDVLTEKNVPFDLVSPDSALPHIVAISFPLMGETLVRVLSDQGIYIGRGAACSGGKQSENMALSALGIASDQSRRTVRISFGPENNEAEIEALATAIEAAVRQYGTV